MIEERIIKSLKRQPMTIEEISKELEMSRATISKYMLVLETKNKVKMRPVGRAKLFSLSR